MEKLLFILFIGIVFVNCNVNHDGYKDFKEVNIILKDSLAIVTMKIPLRYDTLAKWRADDGCTNSGTLKYRFQPKSVKLYLESGFIDTGIPDDSVENLTIEYSEIIKNDSNVTKNNFYDLHKSAVKGYNQLYSPDNTQNIVKLDSVIKINDQLFSIIIIDDFKASKNKYYKKAIARTEYKGNFIGFVCTKQTKINDSSNINFIKNSLKIFESIEFNDPYFKK